MVKSYPLAANTFLNSSSASRYSLVPAVISNPRIALAAAGLFIFIISPLTLNEVLPSICVIGLTAVSLEADNSSLIGSTGVSSIIGSASSSTCGRTSSITGSCAVGSASINDSSAGVIIEFSDDTSLAISSISFTAISSVI